MSDEDRELDYVKQYVSRRQRETRVPQRASELLSRLMARRGYAQLLASDELTAIWREVAGDKLANQSRCGNLKGGVLAILVASSTVMHELTFQKAKFIRQINRRLGGKKVKDLRCRVGALD